MRTVTAADANRYFSKLLRDVRAGETVVVTSRGKPVATLAPSTVAVSEEVARQAAIDDLVGHLRSLRPMNVPVTWSRDDIYDDDF